MASKLARAGLAALMCTLVWLTSGASLAQSRTVIWLDYGMPDPMTEARAARGRALELELRARDYLLLEGDAGDPSASPEYASLILLARTDAVAVLWLGADPERPVSWLFVRAKGKSIAKAPLTYPPDAVDPQLLAIAAASLLDEALRVPVARPAASAAAAPASSTKTAEPVPAVEPLREVAPPLFVQVGLLGTLAIVTSSMETTRDEPAPVGRATVVGLPALRVALGGWIEPSFALATFVQWHSTIKAEHPSGNLGFGIESLWLVSGSRAREMSLSVVTGLWLGRAETPVEEPREGRIEHVATGPFGARLGLACRYAFAPGAALVATPSVAVRLPEDQLEIELGFAAEHAF